MAAKKDQKPPAPALFIEVQQGGSVPRAVAKSVLDPITAAACTLSQMHAKTAEVDVNAFVAELKEHARDASAGNLARSEAMLMAEAYMLDALFHRLTVWALNNAREGGNAAYFETCMRLALKAQSQARATVETLAEIKNPPVVFARQANIANGPQQVNNGPRAREIESTPTKLLEAQHGERLDTRATSAAIGVNQAMEAVGAINGTEDGRG